MVVSLFLVYLVANIVHRFKKSGVLKEKATCEHCMIYYFSSNYFSKTFETLVTQGFYFVNKFNILIVNLHKFSLFYFSLLVFNAKPLFFILSLILMYI